MTDELRRQELEAQRDYDNSETYYHQNYHGFRLELMREFRSVSKLLNEIDAWMNQGYLQAEDADAPPTREFAVKIIEETAWADEVFDKLQALAFHPKNQDVYNLIGRSIKIEHMHGGQEARARAVARLREKEEPTNKQSDPLDQYELCKRRHANTSSLRLCDLILATQMINRALATLAKFTTLVDMGSGEK